VPELPEVETIRRQLAPHLEGRTLQSVEILDARWTRPQDPRAVARELTGRRVERIGRNGKYLVCELSSELFLLVHLRMTGALLFDPAAEPLHTRVRMRLDSGHRLLYVDPRRFGTGHVVHGAPARDAYLNERLGIEPLTPEFTADHLWAIARGRKAPVKAFVLDQRRIAGVGNIYADEALFRAGIHPLRPAGEAGLTKIHVFPYSPRPGTVTEQDDPVSPEQKRSRSARLRAASHEACIARWRTKLDQEDVVLVDRPGRGYGDDYSPWLVGSDLPAGTLVRVRGAAVSEEGILAA